MSLNFSTIVPVRDLARALFFRSREAWTEYLAECEEDRRNGYRPHYCRHGADLWVDYDVICGPCEDGWSYWDEDREREAAKADAEFRVEQMDELHTLGTRLKALGAPNDEVMTYWMERALKLKAIVDQYA